MESRDDYSFIAFCELPTMKNRTYCYHEPPIDIAIKVVAMFLIQLIGVLGNLSIIVIILRNKPLRLQPTNLFLLNLAFTDFLNLSINTFLYLFRPGVIFTNYLPYEFWCKVTPFMTVLCSTSGALSLTAVTLNRLIGIVFPKFAGYVLHHKITVYFTMVVIWTISVSSSVPSLGFRLYYTDTFKDCVVAQCTDNTSESEFRDHLIYWFTLLGITVWLPTLIMIVSYCIIWKTLQKSIKAFPYMSAQSRIARSRNKVFRMLVILLVLELVCWGPWQFFSLYDYLNYKDLHWKNVVAPIFLDVKYYMVFLNSAINPYIYGYGNETMQKAFRLTFPWLFKHKPQYVLKKGGAGPSTFTFSRVIEKMAKSDSQINSTIISTGNMLMAPVSYDWIKIRHGTKTRRSSSVVGHLAKKVAKKFSTTADQSISSNSIAVISGAMETFKPESSSISTLNRRVSFANHNIYSNDSFGFLMPFQDDRVKRRSFSGLPNPVASMFRKLSPRPKNKRHQEAIEMDNVSPEPSISSISINAGPKSILKQTRQISEQRIGATAVVDIHINLQVSSESSVSVTPTVQIKSSHHQAFQSASVQIVPRKRKRANSDPGPIRPRYESL